MLRLLLVLALVFVAPVHGANFDLLEKQFVDYYTAADGSRLHSRMQDSLGWLESTVRNDTAPGFLRADGSWSDINYSEVPSGQWSPWDHFRRLTRMAQAYRTPGQSFYGDARLLVQIEASLAYVQTFYGPSTPTTGNWWFWRIGAPLDLAPALVLMKGVVRAEVFNPAVDTLRVHIGSIPYTYPGGSLLKGQNLVWSSFIHLCASLVLRDDVRLSNVRSAMGGVALPERGTDGVQPDFSFHQHGPQLYTGGYGGGFANEMTKYLLITRNTEAALSPESRNAIANYVADGVVWSLYRNDFDVSVMGREVARSSTSGHHGIASLLQMSLAGSPRRAEIERATSKMLESWSGTLPLELAGLAARIQPTLGGWPEGHRYQYASDYSVHRRQNYFASVKMLSARTKSGERTNGENLFGSRQSDGRFHLSLRGDEYISSKNVWPTIDWSRLPGITVEQKPDAASSLYGYGSKFFVGGTTDGRNGVAAMDFAAIGSSLTAKKGWVFFDDAIVFFASDITCLTPNRTETIVEQWPLSRADAPLVVDGISKPSSLGWSESLRAMTWAAADGVGYYFPETANVEAKREMRSGTWAQLGAEPSNTSVVTHPYLTLWLDHGTYASGARAVYAIIPNVDATSMSQWVASRPISIVANDSRVAAVRNRRDNAIGIIFWQPAAVEGISSNTPAVVYMKEEATSAQLSIADPTQGAGTMTIAIPGSFNLMSGDPGVTVTRRYRSTEITVPRNGGKTVNVSLERYVRRRSARR